MKKLLSLLNLLSLCACAIDYDGETRLVFETRVTDSQGNPKANLPVSVQINDGELSDIISNGNTNANGKIVLIFPAPSNIDADISFNIGNVSPYMMSLYNFKRADFVDYKIGIDNYVLYNEDEITDLNVELQQTNPNTQITEIHIEGDVGNEWFYRNQFGETSLQYQTRFTVLRNSNVQLTYTVADNTGANAQTFTVPLTIGDSAVFYTINY
jgi:5-hydroxyisourate hydrolase-like protein (transthyretin family)